MKVLAIDTSANVASVAICDGRKLICEYTLNSGLIHSETMLSMVESALKSAHLSVDDIDVFACTVGPGSFTGVRIGVSIIKGLAFGKNKPCVGVPTLDALAYNVCDFSGDRIICAVMDARRNQLYNALYTGGTRPVRIKPDALTPAELLAGELAGKSVILVGDGYELAIKNGITPDGETPYKLRMSSAYSVARAAADIIDGCDDPQSLTDLTMRPTYLRPSQAEREADEKERAAKNK